MARKSNKRITQAVIGLICVGIVSITGYYGINEQEHDNNSINNQIENIKEVSFNLDNAKKCVDKIYE